MAENKPVVESIKIGTLEKQIEILEQLGLTKSEITNLIYDTQGQITAENTDTLDVVLQQFAKILEQDELKTIEELARTLLANQSEASVKYVLAHELVGEVFQHILSSSSHGFKDKTFLQIMESSSLVAELRENSQLWNILMYNKLNQIDISTSTLASNNVFATKQDKRIVRFIFEQTGGFKKTIIKSKGFVPAIEKYVETRATSTTDSNSLIYVGGGPGKKQIRVKLDSGTAASRDYWTDEVSSRFEHLYVLGYDSAWAKPCYYIRNMDNSGDYSCIDLHS